MVLCKIFYEYEDVNKMKFDFLRALFLTFCNTFSGFPGVRGRVSGVNVRQLLHKDAVSDPRQTGLRTVLQTQ